MTYFIYIYSFLTNTVYVCDIYKRLNQCSSMGFSSYYF